MAEVFYEPTPNPQTMKFNFDRQIADRPADFKDLQSAALSPLAQKIFGFPWAAGVYIGPHFVSVTKQPWVEWEMLADPLASLLKEHLDNNEPILFGRADTEATSADPSTMEERIKKVLDDEVRPAVAMDGGDIVFHKYENQVVYVYMQGSCSGCPSSTMTLKMGIEARLRELMPEIKEVVAL